MQERVNKFLLSCPGLAGQIARAINNSLEDSQPCMALAAALSFVAALKCGRVVSSEGIEPNLYTLMIADSGSGKSQTQKALGKIIEAADLNSLILGKPASDAGMLKALSTNARRLLIWDEFGVALSELSQSKTGYRALILGLITDLFSSAGNTYYGREYATQERTDIESPYMNIFAASTGGRFFGSLNEDFVEDGFLSRWLVFFGSEKPKEQQPRDLIVPEEMIAAIRFFQEWEAKETGNLSRILKVEKKIAEFQFPYPHEAHKKALKARARAATNCLDRVFWSRARELYVKLCLIVCETRIVSLQDALFAFELTEFCIAETIERCQARLGENRASRDRERFQAIIKPGEWLTRSQIARRAWRLNISVSERNELIKDFVESGLWIKKIERGEKKPVDLYAISAQ